MMRRKNLLPTNDETISIIEKGEYGILSTVSSNNEPYGVPLNYCFIDDNIYFHCGLEGKNSITLPTTQKFHSALLAKRKFNLRNLPQNLRVVLSRELQ